MKTLYVMLACVFAACSSATNATIIDFNAAPVGDFQSGPLLEDGYTLTVGTGHYDIFTNSAADGTNYFNMDDVSFGFTRVTLTRDGGGLFDALGMFVEEGTGLWTISAIGNSGSVSTPAAGNFAFGSGFSGISALVFTQNSLGFLGFDNLSLEEAGEPQVPLPAPLYLLGSALLALAAFRRQS